MLNARTSPSRFFSPAASGRNLPSDREIDDGLHQVGELFAADPMAGRAALRELLVDGRIVLVPLPDRVYEARAEILLAGVVLNATPPPTDEPGRRYTRWVAGGDLSVG